ncbi:orexin receptor type 2 isoform X1 [Hydra vulgaris]|uniref:orexin receptor type 2 isoform X1 n=1 Tax=Hydra vulgaris TaxID=6087 RepID=UPI0006415204|nr:orexin receptor type 2 [Hydra vulgaris]
MHIILKVKKRRKRRRNKDISGKFIANLAVCNLTLVLSSSPVDIAEIEMGYFPFGSIGCHILHPLSTIAVISMSLALILLALERFVAVLYPFKYFKLQKFQLGVVVISHLISFSIVFPYGWTLHIVIINGQPYCKESWSEKSSSLYSIILFAVEYGIPLPIICVLYFMIWKKLNSNNRAKIKRSFNSFLSYSENETAQTDDGQKQNFFSVRKFSCITECEKVFRERTKHTLALLRLFIAIVVVFAIFMLPNQITWLYVASTGIQVNNEWTTVAYWLTYTSSVLNPVIYGTNQKFPKLIHKLQRSFSRHTFR